LLRARFPFQRHDVGAPPGATAERFFQAGRTAVLLQDVAEGLVRKLLEIHHAVLCQQVERRPGFLVELYAFAGHVSSPCRNDTGAYRESANPDASGKKKSPGRCRGSSLMNPEGRGGARVRMGNTGCGKSFQCFPGSGPPVRLSKSPVSVARGLRLFLSIQSCARAPHERRML